MQFCRRKKRHLAMKRPDMEGVKRRWQFKFLFIYHFFRSILTGMTLTISFTEVCGVLQSPTKVA